MVFCQPWSGLGIMREFGVRFAFDPQCNIKDVSINSREGTYHVPGQEYYEESRISSQ
ncbi:hypothetical protein J2Z75_005655 [Rhizobium herbae]|uniref:Uncharacterized protein n=1 Tax=Rhizobium herbae TaxID=508661 RepID=A0ABS4EVZ7_9HYPH|nr:hypothetical protein [Rhizobium herbae]